MESGEEYGPALPPGMAVASESASAHAEESKNKSSKKVIGTSLPPGMQKSSDSDDLSDEGPLTVKMDADMSPDYSIKEEHESEENQEVETVGPMPSEMSQDGEHVVQAVEEFERRSKRMKDKLTVKAEAEEGPGKREEWMTKLPPDMGKNFGLQNRSFSKGAGGPEDKDRSGWTENPLKKDKDGANKGKKRKRDEEKGVSSRDQQMQQQVDEYNKNKRPESLMEMHSKKLKKKKKKEKKEKRRKKKDKVEEKAERRPFDREKDLQVNRFDDAQRKSLIKKSQLLNTRFTAGATTSHFL